MGVTIYQIAADDMFRGRRIDGTGWDWSWAPWQREWMDNTANKFAYRCLPLTIANQTGWHFYNPVGFTAVWNGHQAPGNVQIVFDSDPATWSGWISDLFGNGVMTWNTPFLFRTQPQGSRLLVMGPANYFKHGIQPLTAIIESDWMNMSFTMNWKITSAGVPVRFDQGDPLFQVIPLANNPCQDLEDAKVTYMRLGEDPQVSLAYHKWHESRRNFQQLKKEGDVKGGDWQKDYFKGIDVFGRQVASGHKTKVTAPAIEYKSPKP